MLYFINIHWGYALVNENINKLVCFLCQMCMPIQPKTPNINSLAVSGWNCTYAYHISWKMSRKIWFIFILQTFKILTIHIKQNKIQLIYEFNQNTSSFGWAKIIEFGFLFVFFSFNVSKKLSSEIIFFFL